MGSLRRSPRSPAPTPRRNQGRARSVEPSDPLNSGECSKYLRAMADPERLRIIQCLRERPRSVGEICKQLSAPLKNTSHHLKLLRKSGLVTTSKQGRFVIYELAGKYARATSKLSLDVLDFGCCRVELGKS